MIDALWQMGIESGWWRYIGHFILFAAGPAAAGYVIFKMGKRIPVWVMWIALIATGVIVGWMEVDSTLRGVQTIGKGIVDWSAKTGGLALGMWTANWWWKGK